jgi:hypothetical protein
MPLAMQIVLLAVLIAIAAIWFYRAGGRADEARRARLTDREELSVEEFKSRYYATENIGVTQLGELLEEVARTLNVPRGKLRPTDRFAVELAPEKSWEADDGVGILARLLAKHFTLQPDAAPQTVQTLGDYIRASIARFGSFAG